MCSDVEHSYLKLRMSSYSSTEFFLVKEDQNEVKFNVNLSESESNIKDPDSVQDITSNVLSKPDNNNDDDDHTQKEEEDEEDDNDDDDDGGEGEEIMENISTTESDKPCLGQDLAESDDGFKTPTSLEQKIPLQPTQCPPAPRKPRPAKRKSSPARSRQSLHLDVAAEVELLFPSRPPDDHDGERKIKKARRDDDEEC